MALETLAYVLPQFVRLIYIPHKLNLGDIIPSGKLLEWN